MVHYVIKTVGIVLVATCTLACSSMVSVPSKNYDSRIKHIVVHATSENFTDSMRLLTEDSESPVSAHYLIPTNQDNTYSEKQIHVYQLVPDSQRAWHAGISDWGYTSGLNSSSIGIEVVNEFKCEGTDVPLEQRSIHSIRCVFPEYSAEQIKVIVTLLSQLLEKHPDIEPINIVAHSDISPRRKSDPGPRFPWKQLYDEGIGAWYDDDVKEYYTQQFKTVVPPVDEIQRAFNILGFRLASTGELDSDTQFATRALQMHYRQNNYDGVLDAETLAILYSLIEKYRPKRMFELPHARGFTSNS